MNLRDEAINKLKLFLENPGYFPVLILGDNGVGKEYIINQLLCEYIDNENKKCEHSVKSDKFFPEISKKTNEISYKKFYPFEIGNTFEEIVKIFNNDIILIKDIETSSKNQQNILFTALSTNDGQIGFEKNRSFKRIIFTSSFNIEKLRDSKEFLSDRFWDRISQLVVEIPSFKDYSTNILQDFKSVWRKMNFKEYHKLPQDGDFRYWLKENCGTFAGNFRDLDKIAILWHQYRITEYNDKEQKFKSDVEARIFRKVRKDFENLVHFPTQKADSTNIFEFEKGKTWEQIDRAFKSKFKEWAKKNYGTIKQATKELNMPYRKMDKW